jgi:DNA-binding NarL/FixJ family response regulator
MITIAIIDDNDLFRKAFAGLLNSLGNYEVIFNTKLVDELADFLKHTKKLPDIIFIDYKMPEENGISVTQLISKNYPSVKIIGLTSFQHDYVMSGMIAAGAHAFLSKNLDIDIIEKAIDLVLENKYFIETTYGRFEVFNKSEIFQKLKKVLNHFELTEKQLMFLKLCATDLTYKEIANVMDISFETVEKHRDLLFLKLNTNTRSGLTVFAVQTGLTDDFR